MGCACRTGRLHPLGSGHERVFPWAGVLVLGVEYETYAEAAAGGLSGISETITWNHGILHFTQILGSQLLHNHGLRLMNAARDTLAPGDGGAAQRFAREAAFLTEPAELGLSRWDLLEAAAAVEAVRLLPGGIGVSGPYGGPAFAWLAGQLGEHDAGELCAFLTFLAFLTNDPCATFAGLAQAAARDPETWKATSAVGVLDQIGWGEEFDGYWDLISAGEPVGTPYVIEPLLAAMRVIGRSRLLELLARPAALLPGLDEEELRAVLPPLIIYPSRDGGLAHHRNGVALADPGFAWNALAEVGVFGAAAQLALDPEPAYCDHLACPHHASGLCRQWYDPPDATAGHDACGFLPVFTHYAGQDPAAAWSRAHGAS
ncbi:hypothetical protein J5X84_27370 [Streptosporangiaceae bacterium NEAU-GS5]|nr:hypothetical protein [Streptosporangiaceae bacterium NEAU-GS5]